MEAGTAGTGSFVAECFWPGVTNAELEALERRVDAAAADGRVLYLGSILMREDEVVLCRFEGSADDVRRAAEEAGVRFERILETIDSSRRRDP